MGGLQAGWLGRDLVILQFIGKTVPLRDERLR
jgi:hypothetical protein